MKSLQVAVSNRLSSRLYVLTCALLCVACGRGKSQQQVPSGVYDAGPTTSPTLPSTAKPPVVRAVLPKVFDEGGDEARALRRLGALPAWSAVVERYRLLARRDQIGVVSGLLVQHEGGLRLVDESEGMGSLSIAVEIPKTIKLDAPARVLLWGAWHNDEAGAFVWRATQVESLSTRSASPPHAPGLEARDLPAPEGLALASTVTKQGGAISFYVVASPSRVGDGWLIADQADAPPVARLLLPGERASYGDQSPVGDSERWSLAKKSSYWLEIGRFRPTSDTSLPVYRALTPPFRDAPPEGESSP